MSGEKLGYAMVESHEIMHDTNEIITIAPEGLGYGKGSISVQDRLNNPEDALNSEIIAQAESITQNAAQQLEVTESDDSDGCIDGRGTGRLLQAGEIVDRIAHRPKVAGGGLTMIMSGLVGTGKVANETLADAFSESDKTFARNRRNYGAHSADKAHGPNCGCGAIDQANGILQTAVEFQAEIKGTVLALAGDTAEGTNLGDRIDAALENIAEFNAYQANDTSEYTGASVLEEVANRGKVVAELTGAHKEIRIVLNADIEDRTFSQEAVRAGTSEEAQVFVIDIPRMRSLAEMFETADDRADAFVSMMIYSLATAATLTDGTLPVDVIYRDSSAVGFSTQDFALQA